MKIWLSHKIPQKLTLENILEKQTFEIKNIITLIWKLNDHIKKQINTAEEQVNSNMKETFEHTGTNKWWKRV